MEREADGDGVIGRWSVVEREGGGEGGRWRAMKRRGKPSMQPGGSKSSSANE